MPEMTSRLALPLIEVGQAQKEVTHNEALRRIDTLLHLAARSRSAGVPPDPDIGAVWIVPEAPSGAWTGQADKLAEWDGTVWSFAAPRAGMLVFVEDEGVVGVFTGSGWAVDSLPVGGIEVGGAQMFAAARADVAAPTGGSVVDAEARAALAALLAYLRTQGILGS